MGMTAATTFISALFGASTEHPVYICSFPNERNDETEPPERHVTTRILSHVTSFASKWDRPKRGLFFCVGTVKAGARRAKENIVETIGLHVDIDFKNISESRDDVMRKLAALRYPPSAIVFSGGGLHSYWLFKEAFATQDDVERIEAALRQLTDLVAGDPQCCEISRVLRLPGSHNTKDDGWVEVEIVTLTEARYELDDLEEWLAEASPVMLRKDRPQALTAGEVGECPYLKYAAEHGYKPSIDIEKRLNGMMFMAGGDAGIHTTQIAVSASLLNAGEDIDNVVKIVLEATRNAAGDYGARWNWRREERNIRKLCATWLTKHPQKPKEAKPVPAPRDASEQLGKLYSEQQEERATASASGGGAKVLEFHKPASSPKPPKKEQEHVVLGNVLLKMMRDNDRALINCKEGIWRYKDGLWEMRTGQHWLDAQIEIACVTLGFKSRNRLIVETRNWLLRHPDIWHEDDIPWDQHGRVPTRSGLVDPLTRKITTASAQDFCTWRIDCEFDPTAKCPWWLTMLNDTFADREELSRAQHINVIQELLGAALIDEKPRALSKVLVFEGVSNVGKSELLDVCGGLFGSKVNATPLEDLESAHGLMAFTGRVPWVLHEAFQQGKWLFSSKVKALVLGQPVHINIKNGPMLTRKITVPMFWGTNYPPSFKESTKAITNRLVVIECRREFIESEPLIGAALEAQRRRFNSASEMVLKTELAGLLNWAIAGLGRAMERGSISSTDDIKQAAETIRRDGNLAAGFVQDYCEYDPDRRISIPDFCAALAVWWAENRGENRGTPSNDSIGRAMMALGDNRIAINRSELRENSRRYYAGIRFNDAGHDYWKRAVESALFEGKTASTTSPQGEPCGFMPTSWDDKPSVKYMRAAHREVSRLLPLGAERKKSDTDEAASRQLSDLKEEPSF
jgi:hypothetical protein